QVREVSRLARPLRTHPLAELIDEWAAFEQLIARSSFASRTVRSPRTAAPTGDGMRTPIPCTWSSGPCP
ncbi:MAG: hypothetical protein ACJ74Z_13955, partial [Bryobacteraceae bacterium]